jgi:hypothetical protein
VLAVEVEVVVLLEVKLIVLVVLLDLQGSLAPP